MVPAQRLRLFWLWLLMEPRGRSSGLSQRGNAKVPSPQTLPRWCQRVWGQPQQAPGSTRLPQQQHKLLLGLSSPCRGCRPHCRHRIRPLLSRSPGPGGLISAPHLPSAFVAAASLGADFFLISLATTEPSKTPPWWHCRRGAGFQPQPGGRQQHVVQVSGRHAGTGFHILG